jgi:hypothetical protein
MKNEQCPICYSELEVKYFAPCDDCGNLDEETNHFKENMHKYNIYEIYNGLKLQLCNFCAVDFGSYKSEYLGFPDNIRIGFEDFSFVSSVDNPSVQKSKFCPECNKGLKFLTFLIDLRGIINNENIQ